MPPICEAFAVLAEYAVSLGVRLDKFENCWTRTVDDRWSVCVNGHKEPKPDNSGTLIPGYTCAVTYNGWPAGLFSPFGGCIAAGEAANETTFIEAIRRATLSANA
mgnify:CR=1 FL=1